MFAGLDIEVAAANGEVRAEDEDVAVLVAAALFEAAGEVMGLDGDGDFFGDAVEGEGAGDVGGAFVAIFLDIGDGFELEGNLRIFLCVEPIGAEEVFAHFGISDLEGSSFDDDFTGDVRGIVGVAGNGSADAASGAGDLLEGCVENEEDVVDALGVLEVEGKVFAEGEWFCCEGESEDGKEGFRFHTKKSYDAFRKRVHLERTRGAVRRTEPARPAMRKSMPRTSLSSQMGCSISVMGSFSKRMIWVLVQPVWAPVENQAVRTERVVAMARIVRNFFIKENVCRVVGLKSGENMKESGNLGLSKTQEGKEC